MHAMSCIASGGEARKVLTFDISWNAAQCVMDLGQLPETSPSEAGIHADGLQDMGRPAGAALASIRQPSANEEERVVRVRCGAHD